ncbi:MAG: A/G-specific adenine glycosylase [Pseudomonadota bacterium]|nr:A/G-specific adenine glycosylase [Pseudomonadota bacterium]
MQRQKRVSESAAAEGLRTQHPPAFSARLVAWHAREGRHDLPWQRTRDPYRIWLSEVMLQQTQVSTVVQYYDHFLQSFPDVTALASAPIEDVLRLWSGLGYYRRAQHLHQAAMVIVREHGGTFPHDVDALASLPGVGRSTAAAIAAFAFGTRAAILEGNVKRVFARHRAVEGYPGLPAVQRLLWSIAEAEIPADDIELYTQAIMDLGATVCVRQSPRCVACPVAGDCSARKTGRVHLLPAPRPKRVSPQRAIQVIVVQCEGTFMLERRSGAGVWNGLWSLPELSCGDDVATALRSRYGLENATLEMLAPVEHAFTHYRLTLHPVSALLPKHPPAVNAPDRTWMSREAVQQGALPAPIKRIIEAQARRAELLI